MIEIRPLRAADDRSTFHCGNPDLDRFFQKFAGQNQFRHHIGVTLVAVEGARILGFATIAAAGIEIDDLPGRRKKGLASYPLPVLRLARLAVDESARGRGIGKKLLKEVLSQARLMTGRYGCLGVVVDAKPDVIDYYRKLGFEPMTVVEGHLQERPQPVPMFLPLGAVPQE